MVGATVAVVCISSAFVDEVVGIGRRAPGVSAGDCERVGGGGYPEGPRKRGTTHRHSLSCDPPRPMTAVPGGRARLPPCPHRPHTLRRARMRLLVARRGDDRAAGGRGAGVVQARPASAEQVPPPTGPSSTTPSPTSTTPAPTTTPPITPVATSVPATVTVSTTGRMVLRAVELPGILDRVLGDADRRVELDGVRADPGRRHGPGPGAGAADRRGLRGPDVLGAVAERPTRSGPTG